MYYVCGARYRFYILLCEDKNKNKIFTSYKASTGPRQQKKAKVKISHVFLEVIKKLKI
jgi:hypothetical protein